MLPVPPIRYTRRPSIRALFGRANDYTLWAFNPQPPLSYNNHYRQPDDFAIR